MSVLLLYAWGDSSLPTHPSPLLDYFLSGREPSLSNRKILLLESNPSAPRPVSADDPYSNRVSALSLGSVELMRSKQPHATIVDFLA